MQEIEIKYNKIKCSQHFYKNATFFSFDVQLNQIKPLCQYCALSNQDLNKKLLFIEEILSDDPYTMIANWPPLEDPDLINKFAQICDKIYINSFHSQTKVEEIIQYFKKVKDNFTQKITQIEKKVLQIADELQIEDLMKVYNDVIEKERMKDLIKNYNQQDNELSKLVQNAMKKTKENTNQIDDVIKQYEIYEKKIDLHQFDDFFEGIQKSLNEYFDEETLSFEDIIKQRVIEKIENIDTQQQEQVLQLHDCYNQYINNIQNNVQRGQKQQLIHYQSQIYNTLNSILKEHIDVIKMPISDRIKAQLAQKQIYSNQSDYKVEGNKISNMSGYNFSYLNIEITQEFIGDSFQIKICNMQQWIGIGIIEKTQLLQKNYKFTGLFNDRFCYIISQNGYSWSAFKEIQNKKRISFLFKQNDIIKISIEYDKIIFENLTVYDKFMMDFEFETDKKYCPGFCLYNYQDQIEFM